MGNKEFDYKELYLEKVIEVIKKERYEIREAKVYKGRLYSSLYQKELIDFIIDMGKLGFEEFDLLPYFGAEGEDE